MLMTLAVIALLLIDLVRGQIKGVFKFEEKQQAEDQGVSSSDLRQLSRE